MLSLYNTLTRKKEAFKPLDPNRVTMYACGPTVYNYIHVGNARMIAVFDTLYRVLKHFYPNVVYARNITDIDDKIINAAKEQNVSIDVITEKYTQALMEDVKGIQTLEPDFQPKATEFIPQQIAMTQTLIENGHAYAVDGHVLFNVPSYPEYGALSRLNRDDQIAGARVEIAPYKKDPADFVLWKPSTEDQPGWDSPWGRGRPGWHLECSVMSTEILGKNFDIHGGGLDLTFPHHENEIAQSCCAHKGSSFAQVWMHNGFLTLDNEKMSKSLGNFHFLHDLLQEFPGEAIRYVLMSAHYRQPAEFNLDLLNDAKKILDRFYRAIEKSPTQEATQPTEAFLEALKDDLNTPMAYAELHRLVGEINKEYQDLGNGFSTTGSSQGDRLIGQLKACANMLGLLQSEPNAWFKGAHPFEEDEINQALLARQEARKNKNFAEADRIRDELLAMGIVLDDSASGTTWRRA